MNARRSLMLVLVGVLAAAATAGAGMAVVRRGPVAATKVASVGVSERFEWVDVFVRAEGSVQVGAWQVELKGVDGGVVFVGVEGEDGSSEPPLYDPAAMVDGERLVIGGMRQTAKLPNDGKGRVARVHVRATGAVEYAGVLMAISDVDGKRIGGTIELVRGEAGQP